MEIKINQNQRNTSSKKNLPIGRREASVSYHYFDYIDIIIGDPICSLLLNNKYVIIGTMMGKIILFTFTQNDDRFIALSKENDENISGLSYIDEKNILYASIGDKQIIKFELIEPISNFKMIPDIIEIYDKNIYHTMECDNAYVFMAMNRLLKVNIFTPLKEEKIKEEFIKYEVIYFTENKYKETKKRGKINSTNFYVPLDFDGENFCWVEYLNGNKDRNLCVQFVLKDDTIYKVEYMFKVDKKYGHINHAKLMNGNKILIVHELNKCEIRNYIKNFELIGSFTHLGDEVYAIDILYNNKNNFFNDNILDYNDININKKVYESYAANNNLYKSFNDEKMNIYKKEGKKFPKINRNKKLSVNNSIELKTDNLNLLKINSKNEKFVSEQNFIIITLDIDGNINKYANNMEKKLFNLYDIKGIHQDHKDKKFFNLGYVYYIKTDLNFFCITTDHGCYIIKRIEQ